VDLPPKKKKGDESQAADAGWESTGAKKKASNKKPPVPLTFPGFSPKVADMLAQCHEAGIVSKGELDERVMEDLKVLPERGNNTRTPSSYTSAHLLSYASVVFGIRTLSVVVCRAIRVIGCESYRLFVNGMGV
jgi:hypothetical protein